MTNVENIRVGCAGLRILVRPAAQLVRPKTCLVRLKVALVRVNASRKPGL
jgi:hypothetical protein